jgi:RNA polymerase sigma-70 factor (ECF subfamily)
MNAAVGDISQQLCEWYEAYQRTFINMGLRLGYQEEEVKDMINQFFLDLLEKKIDTSIIQNPQAFLSTSFRRKLIDHYRKFRKKNVTVTTGFSTADYEDSVQEAIEKIESDKELILAIRKAYNELPARCRKVIDLRFYQNLSTDQIAQQTGLSKRSVYNNLFEGIKLLREGLVHTSPGVRIAVLLAVISILLKTII